MVITLRSFVALADKWIPHWHQSDNMKSFINEAKTIFGYMVGFTSGLLLLWAGGILILVGMMDGVETWSREYLIDREQEIIE